MTVKNILDVYQGEVRIFNQFDGKSVCIIDSSYRDWLDPTYLEYEVLQVLQEIINTAVISARLVLVISQEVEIPEEPTPDPEPENPENNEGEQSGE